MCNFDVGNVVPIPTKPLVFVVIIDPPTPTEIELEVTTPVTNVSPTMCNFDVGNVVPIPTFDCVVIPDEILIQGVTEFELTVIVTIPAITGETSK